MCGGGSGHEPAHAGFVGKVVASYSGIKLTGRTSRSRHAHEYVSESIIHISP